MDVGRFTGTSQKNRNIVKKFFFLVTFTKKLNFNILDSLHVK